MPELVELSHDEHPAVRTAAFRALLSSARVCPAAVVQATLVPLIVEAVSTSLATLEPRIADAHLDSECQDPAIGAALSVAAELPRVIETLSICGCAEEQATHDTAPPLGRRSALAAKVLRLCDRLVRLCSLALPPQLALRQHAARALPHLVRGWLAIEAKADAEKAIADCIPALGGDSSVHAALAEAAILPLAQLEEQMAAMSFPSPCRSPRYVVPLYVGMLAAAAQSHTAPPRWCMEDAAGHAHRAEQFVANALQPAGEGWTDAAAGSAVAAGAAQATKLLRVAVPLLMVLRGHNGTQERSKHCRRAEDVEEVLGSVLLLEPLACGRAEVMAALLRQVEESLPLLDAATVQARLMPFAMRVAAALERAVSERRHAVFIVCCCLRRLRTATQRAEVCSWLCWLATHAHFQSRLLFLHAAHHLLSAQPACGCSRSFFKAQKLLDAYFALVTDRVPNVRLNACRLLPSVKRSLRLPSDSHTLSTLNAAVASLRLDSDADVRAALATVEGLVLTIEVLPDLLGASRAALLPPAEQEAEARDVARRMEEEALLVAEQEQAARREKQSTDDMAERARAMRCPCGSAPSACAAARGAGLGGAAGGASRRARSVSGDLTSVRTPATLSKVPHSAQSQRPQVSTSRGVVRGRRNTREL